MTPRFHAALIGLLLLSGACYQLNQMLVPVSFTSFDVLAWPQSQGCRETIGSVPSIAHIKRVVTWSDDNPVQQAYCVSQWLPARGNYVEIEFAGAVDPSQVDRVYIDIESKKSGRLKRWHMPPTDEKGAVFRRAGVNVVPGDTVRVRLNDAATALGWISLRSRINHYEVGTTVGKVQSGLRKLQINHIAKATFTASLAVILLFLLPTARPSAKYALYLLGAFLVHFRVDGFFLLDDWQYLERIADHGVGQIMLAQNEHFIPLFSALVQLQVTLIGTHYWAYVLIALALHAGNAILLERLLERIADGGSAGRTLAPIVAALYAFSGFHAEVLQWLTCSCTVWAMTARLWCMISAWDYAQLGRRRHLAQAVFAAACGPLLFGGSFALLGELCGLFLIAWCAARYRHRLPRRDQLRLLLRSGTVVALVAAIFALEVMLYLSFHETNGVRLEEARIPNVIQAVRYVLLGSQFGAIFRGLLISTDLKYDSFAGYLRLGPLEALPRDIRLSIAGSTISAVLVAWYLRPHARRAERIAMFICGQIIAVLPFLLSSTTRLRYGLGYSFHMRYYTVAFFGVIIMLYPLLVDFFAWWRRSTMDHSTRKRWACGVALALCTVYVYRTMRFSEQYFRFQLAGQCERVFYEQVADWNARLGRIPGIDGTYYEGQGTRLEGLQPLFFLGLPATTSKVAAPIRHPDKNWRLINLQAAKPLPH